MSGSDEYARQFIQSEMQAVVNERARLEVVRKALDLMLEKLRADLAALDEQRGQR